MKQRNVDFVKVDMRATELAAEISKRMAVAGLPSMPATIICMISAICKVIQMISLITGTNPKQLADTFVEGINTYFKEGGDTFLTEIYKKTKEGAN